MSSKLASLTTLKKADEFKTTLPRIVKKIWRTCHNQAAFMARGASNAELGTHQNNRIHSLNIYVTGQLKTSHWRALQNRPL
jgi:hypothetical protein